MHYILIKMLKLTLYLIRFLTSILYFPTGLSAASMCALLSPFHSGSDILLWLTVNLVCPLFIPVYQYIARLCKFFWLCLHIIIHFTCPDGSSGSCHDKLIVKTFGIWAIWFLYCETMSWCQYLKHNTSVVILILSIFSMFYKPSFCSQEINFILGNWWNMYVFWGNWDPGLLLHEKGKTNTKMKKTTILRGYITWL